MTAKNLGPSLVLIFGSEGGYSNDANDPGGPTKYGITQATLSAWRKAPQTADAVKALTLDEAQDILRREYAAPIRFDDLPSGLDLAVLDFSVNSGPGRAAKTLQAIVGATPDGIIGTKTLAAIDAVHVGALIDQLCDARLAFMQSLTNWSSFAKGWTTRVAKVRIEAANMSVGVPLAPSVVEPTAKANPANVKVTSSASGRTSIVALVAAAGVGASTIADQLAPLSGFRFVQYASTGCTVIATIAGLVVTLNRLRTGQGAV